MSFIVAFGFLVVIVLLFRISKKECHMSAEVDRIIELVRESNDRQDSLITLVREFAQLVRDNIGDKPKLLQITTDMEAQATETAAAVDENTPPAPQAPDA